MQVKVLGASLKSVSLIVFSHNKINISFKFYCYSENDGDFDMKDSYCIIRGFILLLFLVVTSNLYAASIDSETKKARAAIGKSVIKCSPDGKNGGLSPLQAIIALEDGMTLVFLPGSYSGVIEVPKNKIIITSEGQRNCDLTLSVNGRDCIVRDINISHIVIHKDIVILDSLVKRINIENSERGKGILDIFVYNTGIRSIRSGYSEDNTTLTMKNITLNGNMSFDSTVRLSIENSILFSQSVLFNFTDYNNRKSRLYLKNNLLYGQNGIGKMGYSESSRRNGQLALTPKDLKKICTVMLSGENIMKQPIFAAKDSDAAFASYILADDSPGKDKGIILSEFAFAPAPPAVEEEKQPENSVPSKKKNSSKKKKSSSHKKAATDDGDIGDLPKPPE